MIDTTTILIDQSYFLQDNENIKSPEEKAQDFMQEFIKSGRDSELLDSLSDKDKDEVLCEFLFISLENFNEDSSDLPTKLKLDKYISNIRLSPIEEEGEDEGEGIKLDLELPQGPEEDEGNCEDCEPYDNSGNSENSVNPDNPVNPERFSPGNEGTERITVENPREIQDGENITIRRDRSNTAHRFF